MILLLALVALLLPTLSHAEDAICTKVTLGRTLYDYFRSHDPVDILARGCLVVAKDATEAQRALDDRVIVKNHPNPLPQKHLKLVNNLREEMNEQEKAAADQPTTEETAEANRQATLKSRTDDPACNATDAEIQTRFNQHRTAIQNAGNLGALQAAVVAFVETEYKLQICDQIRGGGTTQ